MIGGQDSHPKRHHPVLAHSQSNFDWPPEAHWKYSITMTSVPFHPTQWHDQLPGWHHLHTITNLSQADSSWTLPSIAPGSSSSLTNIVEFGWARVRAWQRSKVRGYSHPHICSINRACEHSHPNCGHHAQTAHSQLGTPTSQLFLNASWLLLTTSCRHNFYMYGFFSHAPNESPVVRPILAHHPHTTLTS